MGSSVFKPVQNRIIERLLKKNAQGTQDDMDSALKSIDGSTETKMEKEIEKSLRDAFKEYDKDKNNKLDEKECEKAVSGFLEGVKDKLPSAMEEVYDAAWDQLQQLLRLPMFGSTDIAQRMKEDFMDSKKEALDGIKKDLSDLIADKQTVSAEVFAAIDTDKSKSVDIQEFLKGFTAEMEQRLRVSVERHFQAPSVSL